MSLRIRLARGGAKKRPFYRIVVADSRSPRDGRFIEKIGTYNPMVPKDHPERLSLNEERARHWVSVGAQPSDRVARFLGQAEIIQMPAIPQHTKKSQPRAKTLERMKEREEAKQAAAEAPAVEAAAAEEAPARGNPRRPRIRRRPTLSLHVNWRLGMSRKGDGGTGGMARST